MDDLRYKPKLQTMPNAAQQKALDRANPQSPHGSPYHVHPSPSPVRQQHAFQPPPHNSPNMFYPKGLKPQYDQRAFASLQPSPILGRALCLTGKDSPVPGRVSHLNERFNDALTLNSDTDTLVAKIGAMFPTVSETHIRILLKKYYNREAVVISALQVEKHPLATPGPLAAPSAAAARLSRGAVGVYSALAIAKNVAPSQEYCLPFTTTPYSSPALFRPPPSAPSSYFGTTLKTSDGQVTRQHSPKMKLKYLKSIFPKADEMMILDILSNNDNNVQKVSEELIKRGYVKKESIDRKEAPNALPPPPPPPPVPVKKPPVVKTPEQKLNMRKKFEKLYPHLPERIIAMALESVDYKEKLVMRILGTCIYEEPPAPRPRAPEPRPARRNTVVDQRASDGHYRPILKSNANEPKYRSNYSAPRYGPNSMLRHGPREYLLLADYMPWSGPDPQQRGGAAAAGRAEGPAPRAAAPSHARGPAAPPKGPQGLAKGSSYHKNKKSTKNANNNN